MAATPPSGSHFSDFNAVQKSPSDASEYYLQSASGKKFQVSGDQSKARVEALAKILNAMNLSSYDSIDFKKLDSIKIDFKPEDPSEPSKISTVVSRILKPAQGSSSDDDVPATLTQSVDKSLVETFRDVGAVAAPVLSSSPPAAAAAAAAYAADSKRAAAEPTAAANSPAASSSLRTHSFQSIHSRFKEGDRLAPRFARDAMEKTFNEHSHRKEVPGEGTEELRRMPAIQMGLTFARAQLERIDKELRASGASAGDPSKRKRLEQERAHYTKVIKNSGTYMEEYGLSGQPRNWAGPNFSRDLFTDHGVREGIERMFPALVNLRVHSVTRNNIKGEPETEKLTRTAVLTDDRNGWFSLKDLYELKGVSDATPRHPTIFKMAHKITDKIRASKWQSLRGTGLVLGLPDKIDSVDSLKKALETLEKRTEELVNKLNNPGEKGLTGKEALKIHSMINRLESASYALRQLSEIAGPDGTAKLEAIRKDRELFLQDKALQLLQLQLQEHPDKIEGENFKMAFVGLVNQAQAGLTPSGVLRNERVFIEDNAEIFRILNEKEIVFQDGLGAPYIEGDNIYMPKPSPAGGGSLASRPAVEEKEKKEKEEAVPKKIKLSAIYVNVCAQPSFTGHARNIGPQRAVNQEAMRALRKITGQNVKDKALVKKLEDYNTPGFLGKGKSGGYQVAKEMTQAFIEAGYATVTGCASAKDRTGVNVSNVLHRDNPAARNKMFDEDSVNVRVLEEGTGIKYPKINTFGIFRFWQKNFWKGFIYFFKTRTNPHEESWKAEIGKKLAVAATKKTEDRALEASAW